MKICILPHLKKPGAKELTIELVKWLDERTIEYTMLNDDAKQIGLKGLTISEELFVDTDYVIVLGGDGAILRAAFLMGSNQLPTLGVNLGQLGFLTEVKAAELFDLLPKVLNNEFPIHARAMIETSMYMEDVEFAHLKALNEIVINKHEGSKLAKLEVLINNEHLYSYKCDSLIIATATGSTAYSLSAGGPIVSPNSKLMVVTPVCPHSFFDRSLVLSADDILEIRPAESDLKYCIYIDGRQRKCHMFELMKIRVSDLAFKMITVHENKFFRSIKSKLIK